MQNRRYIAAIVSLLSFLICTRCSALTAEQEKVAQSIFTSVLSPYCPGRLLSDCPSGAATDLKQKIRSQLENGGTEESVRVYLVDQYGEGKLRATPDSKGFGIVGWIVPGIFTFVGFIILLRWFQGSQRKIPHVSDSELAISPELARRIEKDLE